MTGSTSAEVTAGATPRLAVLSRSTHARDVGIAITGRTTKPTPRERCAPRSRRPGRASDARQRSADTPLPHRGSGHQATFSCIGCGYRAPADYNAALNLRARAARAAVT